MKLVTTNPQAELLELLSKECGEPIAENDNSMDSFHKWETETYPRIWREAYALGSAAQEQGLPRVCNLTDRKFGPGYALKPYKSAWEQGWDHYSIPAVFGQMEAVLNSLPTRPMESTDL
jgi:hypothetical protein